MADDTDNNNDENRDYSNDPRADEEHVTYATAESALDSKAFSGRFSGAPSELTIPNALDTELAEAVEPDTQNIFFATVAKIFGPSAAMAAEGLPPLPLEKPVRVAKSENENGAGSLSPRPVQIETYYMPAEERADTSAFGFASTVSAGEENAGDAPQVEPKIEIVGVTIVPPVGATDPTAPSVEEEGRLQMSTKEEQFAELERRLGKYETNARPEPAVPSPVISVEQAPLEPLPQSITKEEADRFRDNNPQPEDRGAVDLTDPAVLKARGGGRGEIVEDPGVRAAVYEAEQPAVPSPVISVEQAPLEPLPQPITKEEADRFLKDNPQPEDRGAAYITEKNATADFQAVAIPRQKPETPAQEAAPVPRARPQDHTHAPNSAAAEGVAGDMHHVVQRGDTIEAIAQHYLKEQHDLGNPNRDQVNNSISHIASANGLNEASVHILNPERTPPLRIPKDLMAEASAPLDFDLVNANAKRVGEIGHAMRDPRTTEASLKELFGPKAAGERIDIVYTVEKGDSLSKIAKKFYGHSNAYADIAKYNDNMDADKLAIGQEINLPPELADHIRKTALDEKYGGVQEQQASHHSAVRPEMDVAGADIAG